jgi:hypothetical protein
MIDLTSARPIDELLPQIEAMWHLSGRKILAIAERFDMEQGAPVYTVDGRYSTRAWTDWTHGFQIGSALLQFDATNDESFLHLGRRDTLKYMPTHIGSFGVHDHGFNNCSTFGNLLRLMTEGRIPEDRFEREYYALALKLSGAVQANRWSSTEDGNGYVYSFNGPHSLFSDTIRTMRALAVAHSLGYTPRGEQDIKISLLERLVKHARATAKYNVYFGTGRDGYDVRGRVVHESIFNPVNGAYRCPSTQQGYSAFTTWTRGLAWVMLGYAEQLEYIERVPDHELAVLGGRSDIVEFMESTAGATCDFYIEQTPTCGIPYWDTGAPQLHRIENYLDKPADPFNDHEPVDSSAAAIAAQGLLRFGHYLKRKGQGIAGERYWSAGIATLQSMLAPTYLSDDPEHEGLLLHSVYHWPRRWDHVPKNARVARGEATMWGDYHLREVALYVQRLVKAEPYLTFYEVCRTSRSGLGAAQ